MNKWFEMNTFKHILSHILELFNNYLTHFQNLSKLLNFAHNLLKYVVTWYCLRF